MNNRRACLYDVHWQVLRFDLKGSSTKDKLDRLEEYYNAAQTMERGYRVYNYLDALVNRYGLAGPLRDEAVAFMNNLGIDHNGFPKGNFFDWPWNLVEDDLRLASRVQLRAVWGDISRRKARSEEASRFLELIDLELERRER